MRAGLVVAHVDDSDALAEAAVVDRQDVATAEREEVAHAGLLERPRDQLPAGQISHGACPRAGNSSGRGGGPPRGTR
jgi:hypothetical protein